MKYKNLHFELAQLATLLRPGKAAMVPHLFFLSAIFFFFLFYPKCYPSALSYCSSDTVWTQVLGFPFSEAKDSIPTPCQDTLSVPGSLQTGKSSKCEGGGVAGEGKG